MLRIQQLAKHTDGGYTPVACELHPYQLRASSCTPREVKEGNVIISRPFTWSGSRATSWYIAL